MGIVAARPRRLDGTTGIIRAMVNGDGVSIIDPTDDAAREVRACDVAGIPAIGDRVIGLEISNDARRLAIGRCDRTVILAILHVLPGTIKLTHNTRALPRGAGIRDVALIPSIVDMLAAARGVSADTRDVAVGTGDIAVVDDSKSGITAPSVVGHRK